MNRNTKGAVRLIFDYLEKRIETIEQAHPLLRRVLTKGTRFAFLTQWDMNPIVNHINSTPTESLGRRTAYEVTLETYEEDILKAFQLRCQIDPDKVNLAPKLIRNN